MDNRTTGVNEAARLAAADASRAIDTPGDDAATRQRATEIRHEIEHTREEMAETIEAIQDKLRPSTIVANATEQVKIAATERVRAMADTAGEAANTMMNRTRRSAGGFVDEVRSNPYPALLIGAGLVWWMTSSRSSNSEPWIENSRGWEEDNDLQSLSDRGRYGRKPAVGELRAKAREFGSDAREYVGETSESIRRTGRQAQSQLQQMMHQNPLLVGAGALMLGAALGSVVPETDLENEWLGDARDDMMEKAQQMAGDAATKVQQTASEVADAAGKIVESVTDKSPA